MAQVVFKVTDATNVNPGLGEAPEGERREDPCPPAAASPEGFQPTHNSSLCCSERVTEAQGRGR